MLVLQVSEKFAEDLLALLKQDSSRQFGSTEAIVAAFNEVNYFSQGSNVLYFSGCNILTPILALCLPQFGSKVHPQYQRYCLNYSRALVYLETLKKNKQFSEYIKVGLKRGST